MTSTEEKLQHAQEWMRREVLAQKERLGEKTRSEDEVIKALQNYFPPEVFMSFSESSVRELITSEILFDTLSKYPDIDGSGVILGYQKVFDTLTEKYITKGYRKYIRKLGKLQKPENIPLEKALFQVVEKGFILSSGRLYELLRNSKNGNNSGYYTNIFHEFMEKNVLIKKCLLESNFLLHLEHLMKKKILGEKRHTGTLSKTDAELARKSYIGDLHEKDSILLNLGNIHSVNI